MQAEAIFEVELGLRKEGMGDPELLYDEEQELFRSRDGLFAYSPGGVR